MKRCAVGTQWAGAHRCVGGFQAEYLRKNNQVGVRTAHCALRKNRVRTQGGCALGHTPSLNAGGRRSGCAVGTQWVRSGTQWAIWQWSLGLAEVAESECRIRNPQFLTRTHVREELGMDPEGQITYDWPVPVGAPWPRMRSTSIRATPNDSSSIINSQPPTRMGIGFNGKADLQLPSRAPTFAPADPRI